MNDPTPAARNWLVYILRCSDNSLYTGITTDLERRFCQHAAGNGAKYFRGRQPVQVVYRESDHSRSSASKREAEIKAMTRAEKDLLLSQQKSAAP
jgi:putative endonuclease